MVSVDPLAVAEVVAMTLMMIDVEEAHVAMGVGGMKIAIALEVIIVFDLATTADRVTVVMIADIAPPGMDVGTSMARKGSTDMHHRGETTAMVVAMIIVLATTQLVIVVEATETPRQEKPTALVVVNVNMPRKIGIPVAEMSD